MRWRGKGILYLSWEGCSEFGLVMVFLIWPGNGVPDLVLVMAFLIKPGNGVPAWAW